MGFIHNQPEQRNRAKVLSSLDPNLIQESRAFWHSCVLGFCLDYRVLGIETLRRIIDSKWKVRGKITIHKLKDIYIFQCSNEFDKEDLVNKSVAVFDGALMVFKEWQSDVVPCEVQCTQAWLWVQVCGLPFEFLNMHLATIVGNLLGGTYHVEQIPLVPRNDYIRIRALINPHDPLIPGFFLAMDDGSHRWIQFKYEKIHKYCVHCGRVGHKVNGCSENLVSINESIDRVMNGIANRGFDFYKSDSRFTSFNLNLRAHHNLTKSYVSQVGNIRAGAFPHHGRDNISGNTSWGHLFPGYKFISEHLPFSGPVISSQQVVMEDSHGTIHVDEKKGLGMTDGFEDGCLGDKGMQEDISSDSYTTSPQMHPKSVLPSKRSSVIKEKEDMGIMFMEQESSCCCIASDQMGGGNYIESVSFDSDSNPDNRACARSAELDGADADQSENNHRILGISSSIDTTIKTSKPSMAFLKNVNGNQGIRSSSVKQGGMAVTKGVTADFGVNFSFQYRGYKYGKVKRKICFRKHKQSKINPEYIQHRVTNKRKASMEGNFVVMAFADGDFDMVSKALTFWSSKRICRRRDFNYFHFKADFNDSETTNMTYKKRKFALDLEQEITTIEAEESEQIGCADFWVTARKRLCREGRVWSSKYGVGEVQSRERKKGGYGECMVEFTDQNVRYSEGSLVDVVYKVKDNGGKGVAEVDRTQPPAEP